VDRKKEKQTIISTTTMDVRRRFFGKDFNQKKDIISVEDLKPMIKDECKRLLEEKFEELLKQQLPKFLKGINNSNTQ
jgi:hypothetical protein